MKSIIQRRSIRKFTNQELTKDEILELLKAGMYAPSAGNAQPWEFIVSDNKEDFEQIMSIHKYAHMLKTASHIIVICANLKEERFEGYFPQDCSACIQNILLQAHDMGLGSVWLGVYPDNERIEKFTEIFNLPEHVLPFGVVALGHPDEDKKVPERFKEEKIYFGKYNQK